MPFLTPELFEMGLRRLGFAKRQLEQIDRETKKALVRFMISAIATGDANAYIKSRLARIEAEDERGEPPPEPVTVHARVVDGKGRGR